MEINGNEASQLCQRQIPLLVVQAEAMFDFTIPPRIQWNKSYDVLHIS